MPIAIPANLVTVPEDARSIPAGVVLDTHTLRLIAANAVRFRLGNQLDWRLDTVLDPGGFHLFYLRAIYALTPDRRMADILTMVHDESGKFVTMQQADVVPAGERVVRTSGMVKLPGRKPPFEIDLDLRLRDYLAQEAVYADGPNDPSRRFGDISIVTRSDLIPDSFTPLQGLR